MLDNNRFALVLVGFIVAVAATAQETEERRLTIDDLLALKSVSQPALSPDGEEAQELRPGLVDIQLDLNDFEPEVNPEDYDERMRLVGFKNQYRSTAAAIELLTTYIEENAEDFRYRNVCLRAVSCWLLCEPCA